MTGCPFLVEGVSRAAFALARQAAPKRICGGLDSSAGGYFQLRLRQASNQPYLIGWLPGNKLKLELQQTPSKQWGIEDEDENENEDEVLAPPAFNRTR
jgi:hypothetical protein